MVASSPTSSLLSFSRFFVRFSCILFCIISAILFWYKVPYAGWFLGFSIVLIGISWKKVSLPKHVYSFRSLNFPILFVLPFIAVILAAIHRLLGLRGGILLQLGMIVASIFISVLLTTDLFLQKHHQFRTLYTRLIPLSSIYLSMMVVFLFWSMERTKMGLVISAAILAIPVFLLLVEKLGIAVVYGFTFFILAIWPLLSEVPKSNWILGGWGFVLFLIAVYRKARAGWPVGIAIRGFYALSILYLLWLMFTFLFVDVPTQSAFLKVLLSIAQVIFVYAMFENFLTRKDVLACIIGFTAGAFFILLLVLKSAVEQITDFNPLFFLVFGLRATIAGHSPNYSVAPILIFTMVTFGYFLHSQDKWRKWSLGLSLLGILSIMLTGSRSAQLVLLVALFLLTKPFPTYRKWFWVGTGSVVATVLIAYLIHPQLTEILLRVRSMDSGRLLFWRIAWDAILESPIVGYGPFANFSTFQQMVIKYYVGELWRGGGTHNLFFSEALESGLVGVVLYLSIYIAIYRWLRRIPSQEGSPWKSVGMAIFIGFLVRGLVESNLLLFIHSSLGFCYAPIVAMIFASADYFPNQKTTA